MNCAFSLKKEDIRCGGMKGRSYFFEEGEDGQFLIVYEDILTTPGQVKNSNEYYVIGVHVLGGDGAGTPSGAIWINKKRFNLIERWVNQSQRKLNIQKIGFEDQPLGLRIKNWSLSKRKIGDIDAEALIEFQFTSN